MCPVASPYGYDDWLASTAEVFWEDVGKALKQFKGMFSGGGDFTLEILIWMGLLAALSLMMHVNEEYNLQLFSNIG